jgi:hypothetical protein
MRIPSGKTDQKIFFKAVDVTDYVTPETGLTGFTVYRSRNGGTATLYTTPTTAQLDATNMPGVYSLLIDEDTTIETTSDSEEYCVHITHASMAPVTRTIELYRRDTTSGKTAVVDANGLIDANAVKVGPTGAGIAQTARDIGASVLLSSGTGTGQILLSSGTVAARAYENGAIWVSTTGATGTTANVHGQASRPVDRISDVTSLLATMNLQNVEVGNGMSMTLETTHANQSFFGEEWTLALGGRNIAGSLFKGANVSGTATGTSPTFTNCHFTASTLPPCDIEFSDIGGTITVGSAGTFDIQNCYGNASAVLDMGAAVGATTVNIQKYSGNLTVSNLKTGDVLNFCGCGTLTLDSSCTGGTVNKSGDLIFTNSGSGMTINTGAGGIDWANISNPTATVGLTNTTVGIVTALDSAYDAAKTAATQTSVNTIDGIVDNILLDTAEIGTAGAGLTNIGTIATCTTVTNGVTVTTNNDKTGYTVSTVSDKTGYSLSQAFPTNFSSLAITVGGAVTAGTVSDKTGYALTQAFPANFSAMGISAGGVVNVDVKYVNAIQITGSGVATTDEWRPA